MKPVPSWPLLVLAVPAFVAVWSGWVGLGQLTGFGTVHPLPGMADQFTINSAITLPIGVETYAAYALRAWLSTGVSRAARRFARWSALGSLALGAAGQVAYHLMESRGMATAPWWITMVVACLPVAVLGMGAALAHLLRATDDDSIRGTAYEPIERSTSDVMPSGGLSTPDSPVVDTPASDEARSTDAEAAARERSVSTSPRPSRPVKRLPTGDRIARIVAKTPDTTPAQIAARLKLSERTVQRHLSRLNSVADPVEVAAAPDQATEVTQLIAV